jgi:cytochrome c oxidase subunit 1
VFGWSAGVIPAVIDATIVVNKVMHNTMWVPGHFHFYLLLGLLPMVLAFMFHISRHEDEQNAGTLVNSSFWVFMVSAILFVLMFLYSGFLSIPRRWAEHVEAWVPHDQLATVFGLVVLLSMLLFILNLLGRLGRIRLEA